MGNNMQCEYPFCKNKAKHPDTILYGFTCDKHFSMLDLHDKPEELHGAIDKIEDLQRLEVLQ